MKRGHFRRFCTVITVPIADNGIS